MSAITTCAPSAASARTVASPRPWAPPVTSATLPASSAMGGLLGAGAQLDDRVAEGAQVRVVGGARHGALVVALHEHDDLPQRQHLVPAGVGHRAPRALLVAGEDL